MADPKPTPTEVRFDYIKSNVFRVAHVDGAFGGPTAHGKIFVSLWSERPAIPVQVVNRIEGNRLGEEIADQKVVRDAFVREVEVGLIMDPSVASVLAQFLTDKVALLDSVKQEALSAVLEGREPRPVGGESVSTSTKAE